MAPCCVGNLFDEEARAKKWLQMCAGAESTRLVALFPTVKVRRANAAGSAALRGLWKQHEPQLTLQPTRLQPSGGGARAVAPKLKKSEEGAARQADTDNAPSCSRLPATAFGRRRARRIE